MNDTKDLVSRRQWLTRAGTAALLPSASLVVDEAQGQSAARTPATPHEALDTLLKGNARFAAGTTTNPNRALSRLQDLGTSQSPFAAVFTCSDSRLPVEILFDQGFGDVFVSRVAGNIATSELIGSLE